MRLPAELVEAALRSAPATIDLFDRRGHVLIVGLGGGVRYVWQDQSGQGTFSFAMLFASLTLRAPHLRF